MRSYGVTIDRAVGRSGELEIVLCGPDTRAGEQAPVTQDVIGAIEAV